MKGFCKIGCGIEVEHDSYEFSDGFVYDLPRDLDGKVHKCIFTNLGKEQDYDSFEDFLLHNKERCKINQDEYEYVMMKWDNDDMFGEPIDLEFLEMIRIGKMFELKKYLDELLTNEPMPYLESRSTDSYQVERESDWVELPTNKGYQLEYLGKIYEIMIRLEDAKKCYDLQYECTKEKELLEKSKEIDKKIKESQHIRQVRENIPKNLNPDDVQKIIDSTEKNIRKYVVHKFSNNFTELFKKDLKLKEESQKNRIKNEDSLLNFNENSAIDTMGLGSLSRILEISRGKNWSQSDGICEICKRNWKKKEEIFSQNIPEKISCTDETCFVKQGGLVIKTPKEIIYKIKNITTTRNHLAHPKDYDQEMFKKYLTEAYATCDIINYHIEEYFKNKKQT